MSTSDKKIKLIWTDTLTELYIKICIQEVRLGNRPTSHLNKKGWANLQESLKKHSNKDFDKKQLKNKWDNLKKEWQIWRRLIDKDTGLGWNTNKRTIEADDDWWNAKLKEVPAATKFREKGLLFADELNIIFGDVVATGEHAWAPSSGTLPSDSIDTYNPFTEKDVVDLDESGDSDELLKKKISTTSSGKGKASMSCSSSSHKIKKKESASNSLAKSLEKISGIVESAHHKTENHSMKDCVNVLNSLEIEPKSPFYYQCLVLLSKYKDYRKMLLCLDSPDVQLGYLKSLVNDSK